MLSDTLLPCLSPVLCSSSDFSWTVCVLLCSSRVLVSVFQLLLKCILPYLFLTIVNKNLYCTYILPFCPAPYVIQWLTSSWMQQDQLTLMFSSVLEHWHPCTLQWHWVPAKCVFASVHDFPSQHGQRRSLWTRFVWAIVHWLMGDKWTKHLLTNEHPCLRHTKDYGIMLMWLYQVIFKEVALNFFYTFSFWKEGLWGAPAIGWLACLQWNASSTGPSPCVGPCLCPSLSPCQCLNPCLQPCPCPGPWLCLCPCIRHSTLSPASVLAWEPA